MPKYNNDIIEINAGLNIKVAFIQLLHVIMNKLKTIIAIFTILLLAACNNTNEVKGYWRSFNNIHPDFYNTLHISDSLMYLNKLYNGIGNNIEFENNKVIIPYDEYSYWTSDYTIIGDTILINDTTRWIRYIYTNRRFLEDISNDFPKLIVLPSLIDMNEKYTDFDDHSFAPVVHIGKIKESFKEKANIDSVFNYKGYYIQINDVFGDINDMLYFCGNCKEVILNSDRNTPDEFIDTISHEIMKFTKNRPVYRTYADTISKTLKIKKINNMQQMYKSH